MVTLTLVIELPEDEGHAGQIMQTLTKSFIDATGCVPVSGFRVLDMGFGNHLPTPLTFTTTETKE